MNISAVPSSIPTQNFALSGHTVLQAAGHHHATKMKLTPGFAQAITELNERIQTMKSLSKLLTAVFFFAVCLSGCTVQFKAKEAEFQSEVVKTYELKSLDVAVAK